MAVISRKQYTDLFGPTVGDRGYVYIPFGLCSRYGSCIFTEVQDATLAGATPRAGEEPMPPAPGGLPQPRGNEIPGPTENGLDDPSGG